jgi:hypothetical protein
MITAEELRELLDYDPEAGVFTWRVSRGGCVAGSKAGSPDRDGYIRVSLNKRFYGAHRLAWLYVHGEWPSHEIDHINCDSADNRIANLRPATRSQNKANTGPYRTNTSGVKGVHWHVRAARWVARVQVNGREKHLGCFTNIEDAAAAYRSAAEKHFGEFASQ